MKNTLFAKGVLLFSCCWLWTLSYSQDSPVRYSGFGIHVGYGNVGIANQNNYGQREMDYGLHTGFNFGIDYIHQLDKKGFLQTGIGFMQGGQDYEDNFSGASFRKDLSFNMITVPLSYRHVFKKYDEEYVDHKSRLFVSIGLEGAFITGAKIDHQINGGGVSFQEFYLSPGTNNAHESFISSQNNLDAGDLLESIGIGPTMGFGLEQKLSDKNRLTAELRGGITATDINAEAWRLTNQKDIYEASRNIYLVLNVGLIFGTSNHD